MSARNYKYLGEEMSDAQSSILPTAPAMSDVYQISENGERIMLPKPTSNFPETISWCGNVMEHVNALQNRIQLLNARRKPVATDRTAQKMFCQLTESHGEAHGRITKVDQDRDYYDTFQDKIDQIREARQAIDVLRDEHKKEEFARKAAHHQFLQQQKTQKITDLRKMKEVMLLQHRQQCLQRFGVMDQQQNYGPINGSYSQDGFSHFNQQQVDQRDFEKRFPPNFQGRQQPVYQNNSQHSQQHPQPPQNHPQQQNQLPQQQNQLPQPNPEFQHNKQQGLGNQENDASIKTSNSNYQINGEQARLNIQQTQYSGQYQPNFQNQFPQYNQQIGQKGYPPNGPQFYPPSHNGPIGFTPTSSGPIGFTPTSNGPTVYPSSSNNGSVGFTPTSNIPTPYPPPSSNNGPVNYSSTERASPYLQQHNSNGPPITSYPPICTANFNQQPNNFVQYSEPINTNANNISPINVPHHQSNNGPIRLNNDSSPINLPSNIPHTNHQPQPSVQRTDAPLDLISFD